MATSFKEEIQRRQKLIEEAQSLEGGAEMLLLECVPNDLSKEITSLLKIPVIGIGAGQN